eukprot:6964493-Prymnesium_polylepis.1
MTRRALLTSNTIRRRLEAGHAPAGAFQESHAIAGTRGVALEAEHCRAIQRDHQAEGTVAGRKQTNLVHSPAGVSDRHALWQSA